MKKILIKASYTSAGVKGLLKVGGTNRKQVIEKMITDLGGKMEAFYFAFGDTDVYVIADMPDTTVATAVSLNINSSGLVSTSTTILITPEEVDKATKISVSYISPGT
ncbi:GYD domain-containing protein [Flavobacterium sp. WC2421]|uniref:GYD domain-containing protein n=3 Tax=unclassified Flavobacterium TaxID=196869 RepID=A0AB39W9L4_9FLAO